jgi:acyl-coenzyme A thioesterase PaaI-like protein
MNISKIPFAKDIGIKEGNNQLFLEPESSIENHIGTIHAGALFTLGEMQSGMYLQALFPELSNKVLPLLRGSNVKYKNPATSRVFAIANVENKEQERFERQFQKKGAGLVSVDVKLVDEDDNLVMISEYNWFIRKI